MPLDDKVVCEKPKVNDHKSERDANTRACMRACYGEEDRHKSFVVLQ